MHDVGPMKNEKEEKKKVLLRS